MNEAAAPEPSATPEPQEPKRRAAEILPSMYEELRKLAAPEWWAVFESNALEVLGAWEIHPGKPSCLLPAPVGAHHPPP